MQFTPLFFTKGDVCVIGESNGGVSGSMPIGPYMWTYHHFTASDLSAYNTASLYQFNITQGVTKDAIVLSIGGGGGGSIKDSSPVGGGAGGAGGYEIKRGVTLAKRLTPYTVQVGHGGDGGYSEGATIFRNGNDGQDSKFYIYDVTGSNGEGGYYPDTPPFNLMGGDSGNGFNGGTGSTSIGGGGGGAVANGLNEPDGAGGNGLSFWNIIPWSSSAFTDKDQDVVPFRIGGGGLGYGGDEITSQAFYFGGGLEGGSVYSDRQQNGENSTGGGGSGELTVIVQEPYNKIKAGDGGHGSVTITFPSTTCFTYNPGSYVSSSLVANWDINDSDTIYDPFSQELISLTGSYVLEHGVVYNNGTSEFYNVADIIYPQSGSSLKAITYDGTGSLQMLGVERPSPSVQAVAPYAEYFTGSLTYDFSLSDEISIEMWVKPANKLFGRDWLTFTGLTENIKLKTEGSTEFRLTNTAGGSTLSGSYTPDEYHHVVITKDNTNNLLLSVNNITSSNVLSENITDDFISSSLLIGYKDDAQNTEGPYSTFGSFGIVRMYDKALDSNEIYQNFLASHGRFYGYPYPSASFDYVVPTSETGSAYVTSSQVPTNFDWDIQGLTQYIWTRGFLTSSLNNLFQINDSGSDSVSIVANLDTGSFGEYKDGVTITETKPIPTYDETLWHQHLVTWDFDNKEFYYYIDGQLTSSASIETVPDTINNPFYTVGQEGSSIRVGEYGLRNYELSQEGITSLYDSQKGRYASDNNTPTKQPVSGSIPVSSSLFSLIDIAFTASYNGTGDILYDVSENFHNATIETVNGFTYEPAGPGRPDDGYFVVTDSAESTSIDWNTTPFTGSDEFTLLVSWYGQNITYENGLAPLFSDINGNFGLYAGDSSYTSSVVFKAGGVEKTLVPNSGNNGPSVGWHITQVGYNTNTKELSWYCDGVYGSEILSSQCLDTTCDQWLIERCRSQAGCSFSYVDCEGITQQVTKPYSSGTDNTYVCVDPCQDPAIFNTTGTFDRSISSENCGTYGPVSPSNFRPILFQEEGNGKIGNASEFQVAALYTKLLTQQEMEDNYNSLYNRY